MLRPSVPKAGPKFSVAGPAKAHWLNQFCGVRIWEGAWQVGFAATGPALFGSPARSGRSGLPKAAAEAAGEPGRTTVKGEPDCAERMPPVCQLSSSVLLQG